jgi:hypothetical protein
LTRPLALPHALLLKPELKQLEEQQVAQGLEKCPFCAEMIKPDARVCRYCSRDLPELERQVPAPPVAAQGDPSGGGADHESEQQRRERLRTQLEQFRTQQQRPDR